MAWVRAIIWKHEAEGTRPAEMIPAVVSAVSGSHLLPVRLRDSPQPVHRQGGMGSQGNFRVSGRSAQSGSSKNICGVGARAQPRFNFFWSTCNYLCLHHWIREDQGLIPGPNFQMEHTRSCLLICRVVAWRNLSLNHPREARNNN